MTVSLVRDDTRIRKGTADKTEAGVRDASTSTDDTGVGRQEWKDGNKTVMSWRLKCVGTQTEKPGIKIGFVPQRFAPSAEETTTGDIESKEKIVKQLLYSEEQKDVVIKSELTSQSHEIVVSHDASTNRHDLQRNLWSMKFFLSRIIVSEIVSSFTPFHFAL